MSKGTDSKWCLREIRPFLPLRYYIKGQQQHKVFPSMFASIDLVQANYQPLHLFRTPIITSAYTPSMSDMHTLSTWIKPTCICTLSSWSEIYFRIKKKKKSPKTIYAAGIAYEWKMWYLYSQQHMYSVHRSTNIGFTAKIIVKQAGWFSAFSRWTRRNLLKRGGPSRVLCKHFQSRVYGVLDAVPSSWSQRSW